MHSIICRAVIGHSRHNSCIYTKHLTLNVNKLCCRASAQMPLSSTESLHYHCITGFFRDQMLWENHIQFQFQRYSWSSSIIILHLRYVAEIFLWTGQKCWYQQTGPAQFGQNHPPSSFSPHQATIAIIITRP